MGALMGSGQIYNSYVDPQVVSTEFTNVYRYIDKPMMPIYTSTPSASALMNGQLVIVNSGTSVNLFTKINGSTYSVVMNKG